MNGALLRDKGYEDEHLFSIEQEDEIERFLLRVDKLVIPAECAWLVKLGKKIAGVKNSESDGLSGI